MIQRWLNASNHLTLAKAEQVAESGIRSIGISMESMKFTKPLRRKQKILRWTPSFRPRSAEHKIDSGGLLSFLFLFDCYSFRASKPFGKERTSRAWHRPSSLSVFLGFPTLPPQAV